MIQRIVAALIVVFWLAMTALLVQHRYFPESSRLSGVPVYHIGQIFFQQEQVSNEQEQVSDMVLFKGKENIGFLRINPRSDLTKRINSVDLTGSFKLNTGAGKHNITVSARLDLSADYKMRLFQADIYADQNQHIKIINNQISGVKTFSIGPRHSEEGRLTYSLDKKGFESLLQENGTDATILAQLQGASGQMPPPVFVAQESSVNLNGETVSSYLLAMKMGDQTIVDIHISQIGQVLKANAPLFGFQLLPHNVLP